MDSEVNFGTQFCSCVFSCFYDVFHIIYKTLTETAVWEEYTWLRDSQTPLTTGCRGQFTVRAHTPWQDLEQQQDTRYTVSARSVPGRQGFPDVQSKLF